MMKKSIVLAMAALVMLSGCDSYAGSGAYAGASLGSILGSAIGGITGGPRGSDLGTIVGMAGGAIIGAKMGADADQRRADDIEQYRRERMERRNSRSCIGRTPRTYGEDEVGNDSISSQMYNNGIKSSSRGDTLVVAPDSVYGSGFNSTNSGDDRLYACDGTD